ncbi:MAG: outer membrane lipoprotein-sorting protein [Bdellovibrionota bacterium]
MKYLTFLLIALPLYAQAPKKTVTIKAPPADKLLQLSDRARGSIQSGVSWDAELISVEEGETSTRKFNVKVLGNDALVEITEPARNMGEKFLFNDLVMWFHKPSLKKPVSVSSRQRNSGQAANGDIANTRYARDYNGKVIGREKVNGEEAWVLMLDAKSKNVTYDKIKYWISAKSGLGVKAEFLTLQGKAFKNATYKYQNVIASKGKKLPFVSEMLITDAEFPENKSTMIYKVPKEENLSPGMFNVNNISR